MFFFQCVDIIFPQLTVHSADRNNSKHLTTTGKLQIPNILPAGEQNLLSAAIHHILPNLVTAVKTCFPFLSWGPRFLVEFHILSFLDYTLASISDFWLIFCNQVCLFLLVFTTITLYSKTNVCLFSKSSNCFDSWLIFCMCVLFVITDVKFI